MNKIQNLIDRLPALLRRLANHPLIRQLFLFGLVGVAGFVIDSGVLYAALYVGWGFYIGRIISYLCSATITWYLNRQFTFAGAGSNDRRREWGRFLLFNLAGFAVNYGAYVAALHASPWIRAYPVAAVAIGSIAGMTINFVANKYLVFTHRTPPALD